MECAIGYYKNNDAGIPQKFGGCVLCPVQFVTEQIGSTSPDDCNIGMFYTDTLMNTAVARSCILSVFYIFECLIVIVIQL